MKVERSPLDKATVASTSPAQPFKKLLEEAHEAKPAVRLTPPPLPKARAAAAKTAATSVKQTLAAGTTAVKAAAAQMHEARGRVVAEAQRLDVVRGGHVAQAEVAQARRSESGSTANERIDTRMLDLICKELEQSLDGTEPARARLPAPLPSAPTPPPAQKVEAAPTAETKGGAAGKVDAPRSAQAMALIERIEVFVRSARPALRLALNATLGAEVEVERVGPRRVALKLVGTKGPPAADLVARIREELAARGLKIAALAVG